MKDGLHMVWLNLDYSRVVVEGRLQGACGGRHTLNGLQDMAVQAEHGAQTRQLGREMLPVRQDRNWEAHPS